MTVSDSMKAFFKRVNEKYSIIATDRNLKRLGRRIDQIFPYSNPKHVESLYELGFVALNKGDKTQLINNTKSFVNRLKYDIKLLEEGEEGVLSVLRERATKINKLNYSLKQKINHLNKDPSLNKLSLEIEKNIDQMFKEINQTLALIINLEKDLSHHRTQLVTHAVLTMDTSIKRRLSFAFFQERKLGKDEDSHVKKLLNNMKSLESARSNESILKSEKNELDSLLIDIKTEMSILSEEIKYLIIFLIKIFEGTESLKHKVLDFCTRSGLDSESIKILDLEFQKITKHIEQEARINEEQATQGLKLVHA